jgi:hypothetical protein
VARPLWYVSAAMPRKGVIGDLRWMPSNGGEGNGHATRPTRMYIQPRIPTMLIARSLQGDSQVWRCGDTTP